MFTLIIPHAVRNNRDICSSRHNMTEDPFSFYNGQAGDDALSDRVSCSCVYWRTETAEGTPTSKHSACISRTQILLAGPVCVVF